MKLKVRKVKICSTGTKKQHADDGGGLQVQPTVLGGGVAGHLPSFFVHCGQGHQILQWLGHVACARVAYQQGCAQGYYVPQSVVDREGNVLDADLVINEVAADGDQFVVELSSGPAAYTTRWEGRPRTPPFSWDEAAGGEVVLPPDAWLTTLDLHQEGLEGLHEPELMAADPEACHRDLDKVKGLLVQYAGALQMLMLLYSGEATTPLDNLQRLTLPQFKMLLSAARATTPPFPLEKLDELFTSVLNTPGAQARRNDSQSVSTLLELPDFMVALVHVAYMRYHAGSFATGAASTPLSTKLMSLIQDCFSAHLFPDMQRRVDKLRGSTTAAAQLLLRKGRRLTEQVLERCQVKRVKAAKLRVDVRAIAKHLVRWGLLGKEIMLPELMPVAIFALQPSVDPHKYTLQPRPLGLDYDQFERLLLGYAHLLAWARKRGDAFEEFLGEVLDGLFKKAGVLLDVPAEEDG